MKAGEERHAAEQAAKKTPEQKAAEEAARKAAEEAARKAAEEAATRAAVAAAMQAFDDVIAKTADAAVAAYEKTPEGKAAKEALIKSYKPRG
jgi:hypothetical protein